MRSHRAKKHEGEMLNTGETWISEIFRPFFRISEMQNAIAENLYRQKWFS